MRPDRRKFIHDTICAALGGASLYSALGNLQLVQAATHQPSYVFGNYKALVCVFLYGGNDSINTIVPVSGTARTQYAALRSGLVIPAANLHPLTAAPASGAGSTGDGSGYGLHPVMPELATLFNQGHAAVVANVGSLVGPVTKAQVVGGTATLPPQLFSHSDQQAYWQSSPPSNQPATGWGGRMADLVASANPANIPILSSVGGLDVFLRGENVNGYVMNSYGANTVDFPYELSGSNALVNAFNALQAANAQSHVLERTYADKLRNSLSTASLINATLDAAVPSGLPALDSYFAGAGGLGEQLATVVKLIWAANNNVPGYTGLHRQIFFVSHGDYDTHGTQLPRHADALTELSKGLAGFHAALQANGIADKATLFTASDFGRSFSANEDGTDHGWGGHHFVVGGAVAGGKYYGDNRMGEGKAAMPSLALSDSNPDDDDQSRMIPTTSVDQYAATLAKWFELTPSDIGDIWPNLGNFGVKDLGFMLP